MQNRSELMLIIGAGPCGLAHSNALKQAGILFETVEADVEVGGNWYHGTYRTAHIISSRKTTEYPDFPMPDEYPDFPSRQQMCDYMKAYAEHFDLYPNIQFNTKVTAVRPRADELWEVELASGERRLYKGVLVCNGHHWHKRFPVYPGEFTGEYLHSKDYQAPEQLIGKRVLVIGGGNSACDIVAEAARVSAKADLSLRRGYWFLPKIIAGRPVAESPIMLLPVAVQRMILKALLRVVIGKYEDYGLPKPDHRLFEKHPTISTEILHYLKHGRVKPRPDVARYDGRTVRFTDGASEEYDAVICATGFYVSFPFLPDNLIDVKDGNLAMLYGGCVSPDYKHLYIIGTQQARYGIGPLFTPMAQLLAQMIKIQDQMELPIGLVMRESGAKLPTTHLVNPIKALWQMRLAKHLLPRLLNKERKLRNKLKSQLKPKTEPALQSNPDMQVY